MARRRRVAWSERRVQVADLVARHERDGRSYRELALAAGLPLPTVYVWLKRLRCEQVNGAGRSNAGRSSFVELASVATEPARRDGDDFEVVVPSGLRIRVGARFDAVALRRLLATLGA